MKQASAVATIVAVNTAPKSKKPFSGPANSPDNMNGFKKHDIGHRQKCSYTSYYLRFKICLVFFIIEIIFQHSSS